MDFPIKEWKDIFISQYNHYFTMNGRAFVHIIVQAVTSFMPKELFAIINSLVFMIYVGLLYLLGVKDHKFKTSYWLLLIFSIFLLSPEFGLIYLWQTGSINYLWTATLILLIIYVYDKIRMNNLPSFLLFPLFMLGLIGGWSHESFSIGIAASFFIYGITHIRKLNRSIIALFLGFGIGTLFLIFSPGSISRAAGNGKLSLSIVSGIMNFIYGFINLYHAKVFVILVVTLLYLRIKDKKKLHHIFKANSFLFIAIGAEALFCVALGNYPARALFGINTFSFVIMMRFISENISAENKILSRALVGISALCIPLYVYLMNSFLLNKNSDKVLIDILSTSKNEVIAFDVPRFNRLEKYFIGCTVNLDYRYSASTNQALAALYNRQRLQIIPTDLYSKIVNNEFFVKENHYYDSFYTNDQIPFYVACSEEDKEPSVHYFIKELSPDKLTLTQKITSKVSRRYEASDFILDKASFILPTSHGKFLLIEKYPYYGDRINKIELIYN